MLNEISLSSDWLVCLVISQLPKFYLDSQFGVQLLTFTVYSYVAIFIVVSVLVMLYFELAEDQSMNTFYCQVKMTLIDLTKAIVQVQTCTWICSK